MVYNPVSGPYQGGQLYSAGTLVVADSSFSGGHSDDHGGQVFQASGNMAMRRTELRDGVANQDGGGLAVAAGVVTLEDVVLRANQTLNGNGGGLWLGEDAQATLRRVTLGANQAGGDGGGLFTRAQATPVLVLVTLAENRAMGRGGGLYLHGERRLRLHASTVARNQAEGVGNAASVGGGGLYLGSECAGSLCGVSQVFLAASLVGENQDLDPAAGASDDCVGRLTSLGHNLVGQASLGGLSPCRLEGDFTGVQVGLDPELGAFSNHGGSLLSGAPMRTVSLGATSPAVDAGPPDGCRDPQNRLLLTDQRRAPRVGRCDLGAYERHGSPFGLIHHSGFENQGAVP